MGATSLSTAASFLTSQPHVMALELESRKAINESHFLLGSLTKVPEYTQTSEAKRCVCTLGRVYTLCAAV